MTNPTPEEITGALAVLRRMPGLCDNDTLGAYARANDPSSRMARELIVWINSEGCNLAGLTAWELAANLDKVAESLGLRFTATPAASECECTPTVAAAKVITSAEDLGSMPDWSVVVAPTGLVFQAGDMPDGPRWMSPWLPHEDARRYNAASLLREFGSVTVLRIPCGGKA